MVIRRSDIGPTATGQCPEHSYAGYKLGQDRVRSCREDVPKKYKGESRAWVDVLIISLL